MKQNLRLLVIGRGGREFAIAKQLLASPRVAEVYCAPGNPGMAEINVKTVPIDELDFEQLLKFAVEKHIDWTFVGPEDALCAGIVDKFQAAGQLIFGPNQRAAQLEGSKDYALRFMRKYHVPTARFETFTSAQAAKAGMKDFDFPLVVKADGLAGGKGVIIAQDQLAAEDALDKLFKFSQAVVLEEFLTGPEYSMFVVVSGQNWRILPMAQDHKRAYDGDKGPNTGGMGSYSPVPQLAKTDYQRMVEEVVKPTIAGLNKGNYDYHGILYIGLMLTSDGPKVIEYNVRLGDPETQVVLPRLASDFAELCDCAVRNQALPEVKENKQAILGVVLCAKGYPQNPETGFKLPVLPADPKIFIDYANVTGQAGNLTAAGGRILMVISSQDSLPKAYRAVYDYLKALPSDHVFYRHDIGKKALDEH